MIAVNTPKWLKIARLLAAPVRAVSGRRWILIVNLSSLGDMLIFRGFLREVRMQWPEARLMLVCKRECESLVADLVDDTVGFHWERNRSASMQDRWGRLCAGLAILSKRYALVLHPVYSTMGLAHEICFAADAPSKVSFKGDYAATDEHSAVDPEETYTRLIEADVSAHEMDKLTSFAQAAGMARVNDRNDLLPDVEMPAACRERNKALLDRVAKDGARMVAICAGAGYDKKDWARQGTSGLGRFGELIRQMARRDKCVFVLLGGEEERAKCEKIASECEGVNVLNLCGETDLWDAVALIRRCDVCIGNDTFGLHAATFAGTPSVVVMGGGDFPRWIPWRDENRHLVVTGDCRFQGCGWNCHFEGKDKYKCVGAVTVADVISAMDKLDRKANA